MKRLLVLLALVFAFSTHAVPSKKTQKLFDEALALQKNEALTPAQRAAELKIIIRRLFATAPKDMKARMEIAGFALQATTALKHPENLKEMKALEAEMLDQVSGWRDAEPKNSQLQLTYADYVRYVKKDTKESLKAYRDCVRAVKNPACREAYEGLVKEYEKPYCPDGKIKNTFEFRLASGNNEGGMEEELTVEGVVFYIRKKPVLTAADVAEISEGNENVLLMTFSPEGTKKLEDATSSHIGQRLVFLVDGKPVIAPEIKAGISGGKVMVENRKIQLSALCETPTTRKIPSDLKL